MDHRQPSKNYDEKHTFASNELSDWNTQKTVLKRSIFFVPNFTPFLALIALVFSFPCFYDGIFVFFFFSSFDFCLFIVFSAAYTIPNGLLHVGIGRRLQFVFITCDMHNSIRIQPFFCCCCCFVSVSRLHFVHSFIILILLLFRCVFFFRSYFHKLFFTKIIHRTSDNRKREKKMKEKKIVSTSKMLRKASRNSNESIGC